MTQIDSDEKDDEEDVKRRVANGVEDKLSKGTRDRLQKMRDFRKKMNRRARIGSLDFVSKLKESIHFLKRGALQGNAKADAGFMESLKKAGQMIGYQGK